MSCDSVRSKFLLRVFLLKIDLISNGFYFMKLENVGRIYEKINIDI